MVMNTYMAKLQHVSADLFPKDGSGWVTIDYHELMRKTIFETSVLTFFGTRLHEIWPDMWEDWKLFNDATFAGVRSNVSWYSRPKARAARERMLQAFDEWVDTEIEEWPETQSIWNDKWGIKMNWEREILGRKFEFTHRGRACLQASFLFVIVTNSAPMATWFTICIFKSPGGVARYREEIASSVKCTDGIGQDEFPLDVLKLKQSQYIQGVWKESLRTGSASAAARVVTKEAEIDGFIVKPGSVLLLPVQLLHFDHDVFPQPQQIDPNRWITNDAKDEEKYRQIQKQNSHLRSFGGGIGLCSGRFVAEQEIINVVSTVLFLFDLEFVKPIEGLDLNPQNIGIMNPKRNPTVRLRRRKLKV
ncbi:hypothetical protein OHC33_001639 [Knufia fluminis]|uniref:Cytochrome P450 n=1 Tax=Knufia fluminis TaxID=191047 RepID=A0AAN8ERT5_9EURO|nr:hypothetical protein OHC33_001639 [Knufia fluminis]